MNREALPLILTFLIPIIIVSIVYLYFYGYDFTKYLRNVDIIYFVIILPFALGLIAALMKLKKPI